MTPGRKDIEEDKQDDDYEYVSESSKQPFSSISMDLDDMLDEVGGDALDSNGNRVVLKRGDTVTIDEEHPFDLESYMSNYTGTANVDLRSLDFNNP